MGFSRKEKQDASYPADAPKTSENVTRFIDHSYEFARRMPRPRMLKTHTPLSLLPEGLVDKCKVIFVARNVKDVAVSFYYHNCLTKPELKKAGFKAWADLFRRGLIFGSPIVPMILEAWELRDHPNLLFLKYEDLKRDFDKEAKKIAKFLGVALSEEKMVEIITLSEINSKQI